MIPIRFSYKYIALQSVQSCGGCGWWVCCNDEGEDKIFNLFISEIIHIRSVLDNWEPASKSAKSRRFILIEKISFADFGKLKDEDSDTN